LLKPEGAKEIEVEVVWEPVWSISMADEDVQKVLGGG